MPAYKSSANRPPRALAPAEVEIIRAIPDDCLSPPDSRLPGPQRDLINWERERAALALRRVGMPVEEISKVLGIRLRSTYNLLDRAVRRRLRTDHAAAELDRQEILDRQDAMLQVLWRQIEDPETSVEHKHAAMDRVMNLDDRRMLLFGIDRLDPPTGPVAPAEPVQRPAADLTDEELATVLRIMDNARQRKQGATVPAPQLPAHEAHG